MQKESRARASCEARAFLWASTSHKAVPGRPTPRGAHKSGRDDPNSRGLKASWAHPYWRGRTRWLTADASREVGGPRRPRRRTCAGTPPVRLRPPKGWMRGMRKSRGRAHSAPLIIGAHCAERAGWPLPSRARPSGSVRVARRVGNPQGYRPCGRPGLRTFMSSGHMQERLFDKLPSPGGGTAPAHQPAHGPPRRARRGACGRPSRLEGHSKLEYRYPYQRLFRMTLHKARYQAST